MPSGSVVAFDAFDAKNFPCASDFVLSRVMHRNSIIKRNLSKMNCLTVENNFILNSNDFIVSKIKLIQFKTVFEVLSFLISEELNKAQLYADAYRKKAHFMKVISEMVDEFNSVNNMFNSEIAGLNYSINTPLYDGIEARAYFLDTKVKDILKIRSAFKNFDSEGFNKAEYVLDTDYRMNIERANIILNKLNSFAPVIDDILLKADDLSFNLNDIADVFDKLMHDIEDTIKDIEGRFPNFLIRGQQILKTLKYDGKLFDCFDKQYQLIEDIDAIIDDLNDMENEEAHHIDEDRINASLKELLGDKIFEEEEGWKLDFYTDRFNGAFENVLDGKFKFAFFLNQIDGVDELEIPKEMKSYSFKLIRI